MWEAWLQRGKHLAPIRWHNGRKFYKESAANHWAALDVEWIKRCNDPAQLEALEHIIDCYRVKPIRGHRAGTKWEMVNMAIKNSQKRIAKLADEASMGMGHNRKGEIF